MIPVFKLFQVSILFFFMSRFGDKRLVDSVHK